MGAVIAVALFLSLLAEAGGSDANTVFSCRVRAYFSSEGSIGENLIQEIRQAKSKLSLALFGFTNMELAEELVNLSKRGVLVRIKMEQTKTVKGSHRRIVEFIKAAGIGIQPVGGDGKNHNKFAVIDETKVITGSYNWTLRAENNWENLLLLDCPELAKRYEKEWEKIR